MTIAHLKLLLRESRLSPEELARRMGISNMTIRRWIAKPATQRLPPLYEGALRDATYHLISEGVISTDSRHVQRILAECEVPVFEAVIQGMGIREFWTSSLDSDGPSDSGVRDEPMQQRMVSSLSQIGANPKHQAQVEESKDRILSFKRLGQEWSRRISALMGVLGAAELPLIEKFAAYGAFFYLLSPFDLIPDHIPGFGFLDDYGMLGFAVAYYARRSSKAGS